MEAKKILTRENIATDELYAVVEKLYKGIKLQYNEAFYLDYIVDEDTGLINKDLKDKHYTKNQMDRNIKALKNAYHIAKGAASPSEIIDFRNKYNISASTFSVILGFSKNTISNIENEGITSLSSGRLIKMCLDNTKVVYKYLQLCDSIDNIKKEEISKRLMEECI
ncbi:transcriptional regulator [Flavobacterium sp. LB2P6]|uniref:transcriptional regulator n=1 Tax=Flavobacterium sp. LB2P6 TaxID=3401714 RepID=UPI003AACC38D